MKENKLEKKKAPWWLLFLENNSKNVVICFFFLLNFEKHNCPYIIYFYAGTKPLLFEGPLLLLKKDIAYTQGILDT